MTNPYFLTRQTANLIEDFIREIDRGSSLFLLYGETGVGKSRLLKQIDDRRLSDVNTHWLEFKNGAGVTDSSASMGSIDPAQMLKSLVANAEAGDVIFIDHFESASNRAQHQLFESWSIDGRDKQLNMIVAADSASFNAFRQLASQMQIEARSFQLMPCSQVEAETYLQFVLFPEEPFAKLLMSHSLKQQLRACNGVFASLTEFAERDGGKIAIDRQVSEKSNVMPGVIIGILLLVIIAAGYLVYSTQIPEQPVVVEIVPDLSREVPSVKESVLTVQEPQIQPLTDQLDQRDEQMKVGEGAGEIIVEPSSLSENTDTETTVTKVTEPEPAEMETVVEDKVEVNPFQSMLDSSKQWIENGISESGTIQIMSVGFDRFGPDDLEKYLQTLHEDNVDIAQLHLFLTEVNNLKMYTIVYGEYPSRRKAGLQIKALPKALVAAKPFPRTIGGLLDEIEKIENN